MLESIIQNEAVNGHLPQDPTAQFIAIGTDRHDDPWTSTRHEIGLIARLTVPRKDRPSIRDQQKFSPAFSTVSATENPNLSSPFQKPLSHPHGHGSFARSANRKISHADDRARQSTRRQPPMVIQPRARTRRELVRGRDERLPSVSHWFKILPASPLRERNG